MGENGKENSEFELIVQIGVPDIRQLFEFCICLTKSDTKIRALPAITVYSSSKIDGVALGNLLDS